MKNLIITVILLIAVHPLFAQQLFVSSTGADSNPGTKERPLKNIQTALNKLKGKEGQINVRGGVYQIEETIQLDVENSGVKIKAYNRENVVFSAGVPVENWTMVKHPLPGKERPKKVWMAKLSNGLKPLTLYDSNGILQRCASGKFKTIEVEAKVKEGGGFKSEAKTEKKPTKSKMYYLEGQIDHVKSFEGAEMFILPARDWVANYLPIKSVDRKERLIETTVPGTYELLSRPTWTKIELYYQVENVPEFLDEPGEWYFDAKSSLVYLITKNDEKPEGIVAPGLATIINIEGDLEIANFPTGIEIDGITFAHGERMDWGNGREGIQHDWDVVDGQWACIKAKGVIGLEVKNCLFENTGGNGVRLDNEGWSNTIRNNEFSNVGGSCISLIGYGPGTRDKLHNNKIINNYIHHCSTLWWLQAGITVCQSSTNLVANNLIHDMPYNGMAFVGGRSGLFGKSRAAKFEGDGISYIRWDEMPEEVDEWYEKIGFVSTRDNIIEHNEVYDVVKVLGDGNAIYLSGTGTGNIMQKNYIHDIHSLSSAGGMRFDNDTWFCTMRNNIIWNVNGSALVSKHINNVENNIMINSGIRSLLNLAAGPKWGSNVRRNIFVNNKALLDSTRNKWHRDAEVFAKGEIEECTITDNVFFVSDDDALGKVGFERLTQHLNADNNILGDPKFYDLENGDFRLKKDSPALKLGFILFEDIGLSGNVGIEK